MIHSGDGRPDPDHQRARPRRLPADGAAPRAGRLIADQPGHFTAAELVDAARGAAARRRPGDGLPDARGPRGARRGRAARPAERRARLRRLRAGPPPPRRLLALRAHAARSTTPACARSSATSRARPAIGSTSTGSSCSGCARRASRRMRGRADAASPRCSSRSAAFISAFAGGWLALRAVRYVGMIIALGAGIRIGAAFFDLIPEAIELPRVARPGGDALDRDRLPGLLRDREADDRCTSATRRPPSSTTTTPAHQHVGVVGAAGMGIHSFLDGVALAAGLAVGGGTRRSSSPSVVIVHRFSDGIGVVSFLLASRVPAREAYRWLTLVAIAPVAGVAARADRHHPGRGRWARSWRSSPGSSCTSARPSCCPRPIAATGRAGSSWRRSAARSRSTPSRSAVGAIGDRGRTGRAARRARPRAPPRSASPRAPRPA